LNSYTYGVSFDQPLENLVTTGVAAAGVEGMEETLKNNILNEIINRGGRVLLHDHLCDRWFAGTTGTTSSYQSSQAP